MAAPAPAAPAPERNAYIDTLRGWSILGVVCVHFGGSFVTSDEFAWSPSFHLGLALNQGFGFAVPLFVFLSGVLAGSSRKTIGLGDYYRGRFWRIGVPYLLASAASFFLLNHVHEWSEQPHLGARLLWLAQRLGFYGIEPTLYFIPLILQLYLVQPFLKALPGWLGRLFPGIGADRCTAALALLFLALHATLGWLAWQGRLSYYTWCRPNGLFWAVYFFAGLHFRSLVSALPPRRLRFLAAVAFAAAAAAMAWNYRHLLDRTLMGARFELNRLDYAYARPEMMVYDLAMVLGLGGGLALAWSPRPGPVSFLGRHTLEIYLWHILVLYFGAWRFPEALASCRAQPELIVIICVGAAATIALAAEGWGRLRDWVATHRVVIVPRP